MTTLGKGLCWMLGLLAAPIVALGVYDALVFTPRIPLMRDRLAHADAGDRAVPANVRRMLRASKQDEGWIARRLGVVLAEDLDPDPHDNHRYATWLAWSVLLRAHFSEDERMTLYASSTYNGLDRGMDRLAHRRFGKALPSLDDREAAGLVAYLWAPSMYEHDPQRLARRTEYVLKRINAID